jgi:hypothetical protein
LKFQASPHSGDIDCAASKHKALCQAHAGGQVISLFVPVDNSAHSYKVKPKKMQKLKHGKNKNTTKVLLILSRSTY